MPESRVSDRVMGRRRLLASGATVAAGGVALVAGSAVASAANGGDTDDEAAIRRLSHNYALGTDAIGVGNFTTGLGHDAAAGIPFYEETFTADFVFKLFLAGNPNPVVTVTGIPQWATFVKNAFEGSKYRATQHLLGTVVVDLAPGNHTASMSSYLTATHVRPPAASSDNLERNSIFVGTYVDRVVRNRGEWRIAERALRQTVSYWVPSPPPA